MKFDKNKVPQIVIHHNDLDGYVSAGVISAYYDNRINKEDYYTYNHKPDDKETLDKILDNLVIDVNKPIFIVDISLDDLVYSFISKVREYGLTVYHIDHHVSSIKYIYDHDIINYPIYYDNTCCAAALVYINLYDTDKLPDLIRLTDDYDTWKHKDPDSILLNYAYGFTDLKKLDSDIYCELLNNHNNDILINIISQGSIIDKYKKNEIKSLHSNVYLSSIDGHPCYALNGRGNSLLFGEYEKSGLPLVLYSYTGEYYKYSIYLPDTSINFDCSEIAIKYGGGGHKGAAGFKHPDKLV